MQFLGKGKELGPLLTQYCFTTEDARKRGVSAAELTHYVAKGWLRRLNRGVYQALHSPELDDPKWEDLILAVKSIKQGVICLTTALSIYDLTEEIPRQHWIAIPHDTSTTRKKTLRVVRLRNVELGKTSIRIGGYEVPIFDPERTIVDAFRLLSKETAIKALKMAVSGQSPTKLDFRRLREYARKLRVDIDPYLTMATT